MSGLKAYTDTNRWYPQDGFLRPKLNTDRLYIGQAPTPTFPFGGELGVFEGDSEAFYDVIGNGNGGAAGTYFIGVPTGGVQGTPSATLDDSFAFFGMGGYGDTGWAASTLPGMLVQATATWTDSTEPATISFGGLGSGIVPLVMNFGDATDGDLYINTTSGQIAHSDYSADRLYFGATDNSYFDTAGLLALADGAVGTPSLTNVGDLDTGAYFPATDVFGITAEGVAQAWFGDASNSPYATLELMPSSRTLASNFSAIASFLLVDNTYTLSTSNATLPVGYNFQPTAIFAANGYSLGSGFLFWNHMLVQNDSGSTRTIGGIGSYIDQVTVQANGGTLNALFHVGFLGQPTINRINSGVVDMTGASIGVVEFWSNGATVGAGVTIPNYIHFQAGNITNSGTVTTQIGVSVGSLTAATNNTAILIGTNTTGNWGIYQSTSTANYLGGALHVVGELELDGALNHDGTTVGFFGTAPVTQQTELTDELTTITFTSPGTPDYAVQNLTNIGGYGFVTQDEGNTVLSVIANLQTRVNELETKLTAYGLLIDAD